MAKENTRYFFYGVIILLGVVAAFITQSHDQYEFMLDEINDSSTYSLFDDNKNKVLEKGQLGDFYNCMTLFRGGEKWRATKEGRFSDRYLLIDEKHLLDVSLVGNEVVKLMNVPLSGSGKVGVAVAVNCQLSLLNKTS